MADLTSLAGNVSCSAGFVYTRISLPATALERVWSGLSKTGSSKTTHKWQSWSVRKGVLEALKSDSDWSFFLAEHGKDKRLELRDLKDGRGLCLFTTEEIQEQCYILPWSVKFRKWYMAG